MVSARLVTNGNVKLVCINDLRLEPLQLNQQLLIIDVLLRLPIRPVVIIILRILQQHRECLPLVRRILTLLDQLVALAIVYVWLLKRD